MSYSKSKGSGDWQKWGRYLERDGANRDRAGFNEDGDRLPLEITLRSWQAEGDEKIYKIAVNPENHVPDPKRLARDLIEAIECDAGVRVHWAAAVHWNTRQNTPHIHIAIRSLARDGTSLVLSPTYLYHELRERAREAATAQIGYTSPQDRARSRTYTRDYAPSAIRTPEWQRAASRGR